MTTEESIVGLDPHSGAELWTIPFPDEWHENIVTPVWTGNELVMSGQRQGTHAYRLRREDGAWRPKMDGTTTSPGTFRGSFGPTT